MQFEEVFTPRIKLRKLTQETYDYIYEHFTSLEQIDFLGLQSLEALAKERAKYDKGLSTFNKKFLFFQLIDPQINKVFGWCGFHTWYTDHDRAEIGYGITEDEYLRKGLMTEAIHPIINYGFKQMKLNRIEAFLSSENIPSLKLVKKMGFKKEGHLRQHYFTNNRMEDSVVYSLLRDEFIR